MKYALLAFLVCGVALMSCTHDDAVVNSSPDGTSAIAAKLTVAGNKAGRDQRLIEENIALIRDDFARRLRRFRRLADTRRRQGNNRRRHVVQQP